MLESHRRYTTCQEECVDPMTTTHHLTMLKGGRQPWNAWKAEQPPDFVVDLQGACLTEGDYDSYDFRSADLRHAFFWRCSFIGATFRGADLSQALFFKCSFTQADLSGVKLSQTHFAHCSFRGTIFTETTRTDATFS